MAVVTVRRSLTQGKTVGDGLVLSNGETTVTLPLLPDQLDAGGLANEWTQLPRPGRDPLLVRDGASLETLRFDCELSTPMRESVAGVIAGLKLMAVAKKPVAVTLGGQDRGTYRITELSCPEFAWNADGDPIEARAIVALTEASDVPKKKGPVPPKDDQRWSDAEDFGWSDAAGSGR